MLSGLPEYVLLPRDRLAEGHTVLITVAGDLQGVAAAMARDMLSLVLAALERRQRATLIIPVGPVDQFPLLAEEVNRRALSLRHVTLINMDEYVGDDGNWIPLDHPLSFRGYMQRKFYDLIDPQLRPPQEQRVFPDPHALTQVGDVIRQTGGVDGCFGGIGINGHIAFNEPPEPGETVTDDEFRSLSTRTLPLSRETRTINAHTVGGGLEIIPRQCVTVGMKEILSAKSIRLYCNRPWQSVVVRRVLHGPIGAACPASFIRMHADAQLTVAEFVAEAPDIRLR